MFNRLGCACLLVSQRILFDICRVKYNSKLYLNIVSVSSKITPRFIAKGIDNYKGILESIFPDNI